MSGPIPRLSAMPFRLLRTKLQWTQGRAMCSPPNTTPVATGGTTMPRRDPSEQTVAICFWGAAGIMSGVFVAMYTFYPPIAEAKVRKRFGMPPQNQCALR